MSTNNPGDNNSDSNYEENPIHFIKSEKRNIIPINFYQELYQQIYTIYT